MGTTLTGTTPQDTYDSLIKVTDNGPISGTLKALSDGLGNDSTLSLSTTAASIAGTLAVTGNATFDTSTLFVDAASNEVGIGTTSPASKFHVAGADAWMTLQRTSGTTNILDFTDSAAARLGYVGFIGSNLTVNATTGSDIVFAPNNLEAARITSTGNVGIGTSTPANKLVVKSAGYGAVASFLDAADNGFVFKADGFNGFNAIDQTQQLIMNFSGSEKYRFYTDGVLAVGSAIQFPSTQVASANANTLDDYEEGTFTAVLNPSTSGSFTLNSTFNTWSYTKIGRQVTIKGLALVSSVSSPVGTEVYISGLPFTILNSNTARGSAAVTYLDQSASAWSAVASKHSINNTFLDIQIAASTIAANDELYVALTYFTA